MDMNFKMFQSKRHLTMMGAQSNMVFEEAVVDPSTNIGKQVLVITTILLYLKPFIDNINFVTKHVELDQSIEEISFTTVSPGEAGVGTTFQVL